MPRGEFLLKTVKGGILHFADVKVQLLDAEHPSVVLDEKAFAWVKDVYGPKAWTDSRYFDELRNGALAGATYALHRSRSRALVKVTEVRGAPADTTEADVRYAVAYAVWDALGQVPDSPPEIEAEGVIHFPNPPVDE